MKLYPKIDLHVDGFYWTTTQRYPTLSKALQALKSQAPVYTKGKLSQFLTASFKDSAGRRRIKIYQNRKKKTRKKVVRRKRRVVRRNPGVKKGWALVRRGGFGGVEMTVVSTHPTKQGAETAMMRRGFNPGEMDGSRYKAIQFGPGTGYEYLNTEFTGKFLRPIVGNRRRGLRGNPARTDKAHFGYAKMGMELLGTGLKIKKGERVYMTPATNIPGGGFFVEPAYRTGLWKQGSADDAILIAPKDFDDEITYVEPRGEYRPTPQVKPDYKYGIYTGRGIARNSSHSDLIDGAVDVIINTRDFCGNEKQAVRDYCFENKVSDCKGLYRMAMAKANSKWNAYRREAGVKCVRRNGIMADSENAFLVKYGLTPDQARSKFFAMIGSSFEKARKLSFEEQVKIRDEYEVFKKKLLKAKMSMRRR